MPTRLVNMAPSDIQEFACQTLAAGDLELWRVKDGRFLIHLAFKGQRNAWIELSPEQAHWLAGQLSKS